MNVHWVTTIETDGDRVETVLASEVGPQSIGGVCLVIAVVALGARFIRRIGREVS